MQSVELIEEKPLTYEEVVSIKDNVVWNRLAGVTVDQAAGEWIKTLGPSTADRYARGLRYLERESLLKGRMSLQAFALLNHNSVVDHIKKDDIPWSECTRQCHAALYISFTKFLNRRFGSILPIATPSREKGSKTFFSVRDKVKTNALTMEQAQAFIAGLEERSRMYALIAKMLLQGAKRVSEVIDMKKQDINWDKGEVAFHQLKTSGLQKTTVITFPYAIMQELRTFCEANPDYEQVFITKKGNSVHKNDVCKFFKTTGVRIGMPFRITPHVMRTSAITAYKELGCSTDEIMKVSGHATSECVMAYDKTDMAKNPSKRFCLV